MAEKQTTTPPESGESIADALRASFTEEAPETEPSSFEEEIETEAEAEVETEGEEAEPVGVTAPEHWSAEDRDLFSKLPPEAQSVLLNKDKEWQRGYQQVKESTKDWETLFEPYKQRLDYMGMTPQQAVRQLLAAQQMLDSNPLQGIQQLAQSYGVDLRQLYASKPDDEYVDPEVKRIREELQQTRSYIENQARQAQMQNVQTIQQQITAFKSAKDEAGNPAHPHFDSVRHLMAPLVQQGKSLEEAYREAVWSVPEYRESAIKAEREKAAAELDAARKKKAADAKKRGRAVSGSSKGGDPAEEGLSLREVLESQFRQATR